MLQYGPHRLYDNTRLSAYKQCPRKYFYRHILNWSPEGRTPPPLVFGSAWHAAMDIVWTLLAEDPNMPPDLVVLTAYDAFLEVWTENGYPDPDAEVTDPYGTTIEGLQPRTPLNALNMLYAYVALRKDLISRCELLSVEKPFIVPLSKDLSTLYIGKLDKVVRFEGRVSSIEHKTTTLYSKASGIRPSFMDSFSPNSQVDGYLHALKMLYGEESKSVLVDIALVHKSTHDAFAIQPVEKNLTLLGEWLEDTSYWITRAIESEELNSWPKNTNACFDYATTCPYADFCRGFEFEKVQERAKDGPLPGFKVEVWNPVEELKINIEELLRGL